MKPTLDQLIEQAKLRASLDKRGKNKGRPKIGMPKSEEFIVSSMRKRGVSSLMAIHSLLKEHEMTRYANYGTFLAAYKNR